MVVFIPILLWGALTYHEEDVTFRTENGELTALGIGVPCGLAGIIWGLRELFLRKKAKRVLCAYLEERNG